MMPENVILGPSSKSTGAKNGAQNLIFWKKMTPFSQRCGRPPAVLEATGATEAARGAQSIIFMIFDTFRLHFHGFVTNVWLITGSFFIELWQIVVECWHYFRTYFCRSPNDKQLQRTISNRTVASFMDFRYIFHGFWTNCWWFLALLHNIFLQIAARRATATNNQELPKTFRKRNCIAPIYRFAKRQQLQQTHAPKRRSTKWGGGGARAAWRTQIRTLLLVVRL